MAAGMKFQPLIENKNNKNLEYKSRDGLLRLHKALVRPHWEYCEQFWAPYLRKDVLALGKAPEEVHKNDPWNEELVSWGLWDCTHWSLEG